MEIKNSDIQQLIEVYNNKENQAKEYLPNTVLEAFQVVTFQAIGWPSRINNKKELWRYHDTMHSHPDRYRRYLNLLSDISQEDIKLMEKASEIIYNFSKNNDFIYCSSGKNALTVALYQKKIIEKYFDVPRNKLIFEIGPGCGYLGLLLGLSGYSYIAMEACQAFYIYQSSLFRYAFGSDYNDGLNDNDYLKINHMTWWDFNSRNLKVENIGLATCNHAVRELHPSAFNRLLTVMKNSCDVPKIISEDLGQDVCGHLSQLDRNLCQQGFSMKSISQGIYLFEKSNIPGLNISNLSKLIQALPSPLRKIGLISKKILRKLKIYSINNESKYLLHPISYLKPLKTKHILDSVFDKYEGNNLPPDLSWELGDW